MRAAWAARLACLPPLAAFFGKIPRQPERFFLS